MTPDLLPDDRWHELLRVRATRPQAIAEAYARRRRPERIVGSRGTLFLVAADHPARGALGVPGDPLGMADRRGLLRRLLVALENPDVDGLLGSPDVVEELLLLGALEGKVVIGSMNRGGLYGATWTMDDRFTGYDAASIVERGLEGGKMLLRIDDDDAGTARTIEGCADALTGLAARGLLAMVEPLPYARDGDGPHPAAGRRVAHTGRHGRVRAGHHQRLHLAQAARLRRPGGRVRSHDAALRGARRRPRSGPRA
jgi:hypothetical protein